MRLFPFVILALLAGAACAISFFEVVVEEWEGWKLAHGDTESASLANFGENNNTYLFAPTGKLYNSSTEEKFRMKIFMENKAKIAKHNSRAIQGHKPYFLEMNHYGDLVSQ
jgi:cathepsin L